MGLKFNYRRFQKRVDAQTGSILFYREDIKGLPEKIYDGDGFTVEVKNNQVYVIDIFNAEKVLKKMLKTIMESAA